MVGSSSFTPSGKTEAIRIRPGVCIYKQPQSEGRGSPYWYARIHLKLGGKLTHTKSTKTTDWKEAVRQAEDFHTDLKIIERYGTAPPGSGPIIKQKPRHRFDKVADDWLTRLRAAAGSDERKLRALRDAQGLCLSANGLCAFFGKMELSSISTDTIHDYLIFAASNSKAGQLASTTKRNHLSHLKAIFRFALEKRLITVVPPMPKVRLVDNPRSWFTADEYRALWKGAAERSQAARAAGDLTGAHAWREMQDFIIFMVSTFLRPSEFKLLQHKHVTVHRGEHHHLEIAVPNGKTGQRIVRSMKAAVHVYGHIVKRNGSEPEGYLFGPRYRNRTTAYEAIHHRFNQLLAETGLGPDKFGRKRTIYSLRHTSLMLRVLNGDNVDYFALAKNAGTSVDQLQRFYLSHVDPAMKLANLQSFKGG